MRLPTASLAAAALLAAAPPAAAAAARSLDQTTTSYATIGGDAAAPYSRLKLLPGWKRVVGDDHRLAPPQGPRAPPPTRRF